MVLFQYLPILQNFEMITFGVNAQVETRGSIWNSWHQSYEMFLIVIDAPEK